MLGLCHKRLLLLWLFIAILWMGHGEGVLSVPSEINMAANSVRVEEISANGEIGEALNLEELGLDYWLQAPDEILSEHQLIKLSRWLRDVARYMGSKWSVNVAIDRPHKSESNSKNQLSKLVKWLKHVVKDTVFIWHVNAENKGKSQDEERSHLIITDLREPDGNWISMTAGQALKMVTQELQILKTSGEELLIDFLVIDEASGKYRKMIGVPLSRYCHELLRSVNN